MKEYKGEQKQANAMEKRYFVIETYKEALNHAKTRSFS